MIIHCLSAKFQGCLSWQCTSSIPLLVTIQRLDWCIILPVSLFNYCSVASSGAFISSSGRGGALGMRGEVGRWRSVCGILKHWEWKQGMLACADNPAGEKYWTLSAFAIKTPAQVSSAPLLRYLVSLRAGLLTLKSIWNGIYKPF